MTQAYYPPAGYEPRPSVIADLIRAHRDKMRGIWERHERELWEALYSPRRAA